MLGIRKRSSNLRNEDVADNKHDGQSRAGFHRRSNPRRRQPGGSVGIGTGLKFGLLVADNKHDGQSRAGFHRRSNPRCRQPGGSVGIGTGLKFGLPAPRELGWTLFLQQSSQQSRKFPITWTVVEVVKLGTCLIEDDPVSVFDSLSLDYRVSQGWKVPILEIVSISRKDINPLTTADFETSRIIRQESIFDVHKLEERDVESPENGYWGAVSMRFGLGNPTNVYSVNVYTCGVKFRVLRLFACLVLGFEPTGGEEFKKGFGFAMLVVELRRKLIGAVFGKKLGIVIGVARVTRNKVAMRFHPAAENRNYVWI
ncbi:hypothetical protein WN48_01317 [Eufriesea mexicana]|uniref:Uncharacterized protein n=1 Tax=Eufriesea mexicana TaxID=516756 RepID=A0A310SCE4_9HYME|nr:hypothetical protein WN48_01317 [Eufriesea mexicana]